MAVTRARSRNEASRMLIFTKRSRNGGLRKSASFNAQSKRRTSSKRAYSHVIVGIRHTESSKGLKLDTDSNATPVRANMLERNRRVAYYNLRSGTELSQTPSNSGPRRKLRKRPGLHLITSTRVMLSDTCGGFTPPLSKRAVQFMRRMHIPMLPAFCDWSQEQCLKYLNWRIDLKWAADSLDFEDRDKTLHALLHGSRESDLSDHNRCSQDLLTPPPTEVAHPDSIGDVLQRERYRMRQRLAQGSFQVPTDWVPIQDVYLPTCLGAREGTFDSWISLRDGVRPDTVGLHPQETRRHSHEQQRDEPQSQVDPHTSPWNPSTSHTPTSVIPRPLRTPPPSHSSSSPHTWDRRGDGAALYWTHTTRRSGMLTPESDRIDTEETDYTDSSNTIKGRPSRSPSPPSYDETAIHFVPKFHPKISSAHNWELATAMKSQAFEWGYQKPESLHSRAVFRHVRLFPANRCPLNTDIYFSGASARLLSLDGDHIPGSQEAGFASIIGRIIADVIATEAIPAHCQFYKKSIPGWQCSSTPVLLDVACLPSAGVLSWDQRTVPLLLAAQFSEGVGGRDLMAAEPLACAFHSTIVILILYYLDTRAGVEDDLPPWLFIYGIIYTKSGFSIHEHYPVYRPRTLDRPAEWGAASSLAVHFEYAFDPQSMGRHQPLSALLRVCGHTQFVLENLIKWDGYQRVIASRFIPHV